MWTSCYPIHSSIHSSPGFTLISALNQAANRRKNLPINNRNIYFGGKYMYACVYTIKHIELTSEDLNVSKPMMNKGWVWVALISEQCIAFKIQRSFDWLHKTLYLFFLITKTNWDFIFFLKYPKTQATHHQLIQI